jgi:hypothetical protein
LDASYEGYCYDEANGTVCNQFFRQGIGRVSSTL